MFHSIDMKGRILLIDDNINLTTLLAKALEKYGYEPIEENDSVRAFSTVQRVRPDLILLDVIMPGKDGGEVLAELRSDFHLSRIPVIMLTARGDDMDRILGLELGADDYVPKPCNPRELLARIRAVTRRAQGVTDQGVLSVDDLELSQGSRSLLKNGEPVDLTSTEFSILLALLQHQGEVVSKRDLYMLALGREPVPHDRSVDMHVSNLRRKLGEDHEGKNRIETIRGIGYQYRVP